MMNSTVKKTIRFLIKIPATPFVVVFNFAMITAAYLILFTQYLYDKSAYDKELIREMIHDFTQDLKKWFTTI